MRLNEEEYIGDTDAKAPAETAARQVAALLKGFRQAIRREELQRGKGD